MDAAAEEADREGEQQPESGPAGLPAQAQAEADTSGKGTKQEDADRQYQPTHGMDVVRHLFWPGYLPNTRFVDVSSSVDCVFGTALHCLTMM